MLLNQTETTITKQNVDPNSGEITVGTVKIPTSISFLGISAITVDVQDFLRFMGTFIDLTLLLLTSQGG